MKAMVKLAALLVLAHAAAAQAAASEVVHNVLVRPGVTERVLLHRGQDGAPTLILLPGGDGHIFITPDGVMAENNSFLARARRLFWPRGFSTALVDAPTDRHDANGLYGLRSTEWHAHDLEQIARSVGEGGPVWLVGSSAGAVSAANALSRLPYVFTGGILSATPMYPSRKRDVTISDVDLAAIKARVLVLHHEADNCAASPPELMDRLAFELTSARVDRAIVSGGISPGADPCGRLSYHSFFSSERAAVDAIVDFITR
jgi:predicted esterase